MRHPLLAPALVLLAHGSRDPRAAGATGGLARAVAAARPGLDVRAAYLDHARPAPAEVLAALAGAGRTSAVVVPLLLTSAYHGRVDVPAALADPPLAVLAAGVLGPDPALLPALLRGAAGSGPGRDGPGPDGLVLIAAGTSDAAARAGVDGVAAALGDRLGVPALAGYSSATGPRPDEAVAALRAAGAARVAVAAYFLAPGLLHDRARRSALRAGAVSVADPLGAAPGLVRLILTRYAGAVREAPAASPRAARWPAAA